jgi:hypothetical protein
MPEPAPLHPVSRLYLEAISDEVGIFQHAAGAVADPAHGYCADDVARALQVDLLHARVLGWPAVAPSAWRNLRFLVAAYDERAGRFRNFRGVGGEWLPGAGSQDCQGRAMHALGDAIAAAPGEDFSDVAADVFLRALPGTREVSALRALSSIVLGCEAAVRGGAGSEPELVLRRLSDRLAAMFRDCPDPAWPWPEPRVTYENGLPVRALIVAGRQRGDRRMVRAGTKVLDWLVTNQTAPDGHLSPVGNGWWARGGSPAKFDQQPIEAAALLLAAEAALAATGDPGYRAVAERAYAWFLGGNDLGILVADPARGACYDGLTATGVNANQGAESTLMWLTALEHIRVIRGAQEQAVSGAARYQRTRVA